MPRRIVRPWVTVALVVGLLAIAQALNGAREGRAAGGVAVTQQLTAAEQAATFTYDASVGAGHRALIERAIARARPEAQRLFAIVDGVTTMHVGEAPDGNLGVAAPQRDGTYVLTLDLATTMRTLGERGVTRLVVHELGHVVDFVLVDPALARNLDVGIPPGLPCPPGTRIGSCAPGAERFAESFAKWAMNDLGLDLYIGYAVPAPADIEAWAAPLAQLDAE